MTFDVAFMKDGIHLLYSDDYGTHVKTIFIPHIAASRAMAEGNYEFEHQERDIYSYLLEHGYSLQGLYTRNPIAIQN